MTDQTYNFSRWIYSIMEGFFNWIKTLFVSGRLDFFFENWVMIAIVISVAAFLIDTLLYYLSVGKETLAVKAMFFVYDGCRALYYKARGINPEEAEGDFAAHIYELDEEPAEYVDAAFAGEPVTFENLRTRETFVGAEPATVTREDAVQVQYGGQVMQFPQTAYEPDKLMTDELEEAYEAEESED